MAERDIKSDASYVEKLSALLPGEVTALYLFIRSLTQNNLDLFWLLMGFALLIAMIFYFILPSLLGVQDSLSRILYSFTFLTWVASIEVYNLQVKLDNLAAISFVIPAFTALWTFTVPYVFDSLKGRR